MHPDTVSSLMAKLIQAANEVAVSGMPQDALPRVRLHHLRHIRATTSRWKRGRSPQPSRPSSLASDCRFGVGAAVPAGGYSVGPTTRRAGGRSFLLPLVLGVLLALERLALPAPLRMRGARLAGTYVLSGLVMAFGLYTTVGQLLRTC